MDSIKPYAKAVVGALVAGLTALGAALTDDHVTAAEWVAVAIATLGSAGFVYAVPNTPKALARVRYPDGTEPPTGADGLQQLGLTEKDVDDDS